MKRALMILVALVVFVLWGGSPAWAGVVNMGQSDLGLGAFTDESSLSACQLFLSHGGGAPCLFVDTPPGKHTALEQLTTSGGTPSRVLSLFVINTAQVASVTFDLFNVTSNLGTFVCENGPAGFCTSVMVGNVDKYITETDNGPFHITFTFNHSSGTPQKWVFYVVPGTTTTNGNDPTGDCEIITITPTPEPGALLLFGSGLAVLGTLFRKRLRRS